MANEFLAFAIVLVFAANAFLYYRWKALKEETQEKQTGSRVTFAKEMLDTFYATPPKTLKQNDLFEEAKTTLEELRRITETDVVELHQKMVSSSQKIAA